MVGTVKGQTELSSKAVAQRWHDQQRLGRQALFGLWFLLGPVSITWQRSRTISPFRPIASLATSTMLVRRRWRRI